MIVRTTFKRDLEFPSEILVVLIAHEITKKRLRIRRYIECLSSRCACAIAGRDVAYCVAARFARGDAGFSQEAQKVRSFFELDVIDLRIFASSEMQEPTAKSVCRICQANQLLSIQDPTGNLDSLHLHSLLALS